MTTPPSSDPEATATAMIGVTIVNTLIALVPYLDHRGVRVVTALGFSDEVQSVRTLPEYRTRYDDLMAALVDRSTELDS